MLSYISNVQSSVGASVEHRVWTQRLLARHCMLTASYVRTKSQSPGELLLASSLIAPVFILAPFRAWDEFWDNLPRAHGGTDIFDANRGDVPQRQIWKAYYESFSLLLQLDSTYRASATGERLYEKEKTQDGGFFSKPKSQQCVELKRIQSIYEKYLMNELSFPKANEDTPEIEDWADQVIVNWKVVCGPTWRDEDHINGGKESTSRMVLDVCVKMSPLKTTLVQKCAQILIIATDVQSDTDSLSGCYQDISLNSDSTPFVHCSQISDRLRSCWKSFRLLHRDRNEEQSARRKIWPTRIGSGQ